MTATQTTATTQTPITKGTDMTRIDHTNCTHPSTAKDRREAAFYDIPLTDAEVVARRAADEAVAADPIDGVADAIIAGEVSFNEAATRILRGF